jgi:glutathione S-transferase
VTYRLITANKNYSSWSLRPWILMRELGIGFEEEVIPFELENYARFRAFSPSATVPCLIDSERTVWDSLGIALYLAERHDGVWPQDPDARAWAGCVVAEMHSGFGALRSRCSMSVGQRVKLRETDAALSRDVARIAAIWGEGLARFGGPFLAGPKFTIADAFYAPVAYRVRTYGLDVGAAGAAWVAHMLALPGMREWEEAALAETWRDEPHEVEVRAAGEVTADYRVPL